MENTSVKETALTKYKELKSKFGRQPKSVEFFEVYSEHQLRKAFGVNAFSELVKLAGDEPNKLIGADIVFTNEDALTTFGNTTRKLGHQPALVEWLNLGLSPSASWFRKNIGSWSKDVPDAFIDFAVGKSEWEAVLGILRKQSNEPVGQKSPSENDDTAYLPQILQGIDILATKEGASLEFERKVNLAFRILGFQVLELGQGTGRNIDGVALDLNSRFAVLIDAKARREGYSIGTDDRIFVEYIKGWQDKLRRMGMTHLFLGIVSSRFKSDGEKAISNIKRESSISAVNMISVNQLIGLVISKVKYPAQFDLEKLKEILVTDGKLNSKNLTQWIGDMDKTYTSNVSRV